MFWSAVSAIGSFGASVVLLVVFLLGRAEERVRKDQEQFDVYLLQPIREVVLAHLESQLGMSRPLNPAIIYGVGESGGVTDGPAELIKQIDDAHYDLATRVHHLALAYGDVISTTFLVRRLEAALDRFTERGYSTDDLVSCKRYARNYTHDLLEICTELRTRMRPASRLA